MADKQLKTGDRVEWQSSGGHSTGKVVEKVTKTTRIKGHLAKATPEDPQYRVKSESGGEALHKPESLKKAT
jgi:hypothetical protein